MSCSKCGFKKRLASTLDDITITTLAKRQKIIRLVDKSSAGWSTVDEYLQYKLASDTDDDKKMRQAEARALAKLRREKANDKGLRLRRDSYSTTPCTRPTISQYYNHLINQFYKQLLCGFLKDSFIHIIT